MKNASDAIDESELFLTDFRFCQSSKLSRGSEERSLYAKFQALLLWQLVLENEEELNASGFFDEFYRTRRLHISSY
jgi:hypothetical protein